MALDGPRCDVAGHSQALAVGAVAQTPELADSDVIAFALLHAGVAQVSQSEHDDGDSRAKLHIFFAGSGHVGVSLPPLCLQNQAWKAAAAVICITGVAAPEAMISGSGSAVAAYNFCFI